jgi:WD40-like Beta Propeller Repeat
MRARAKAALFVFIALGAVGAPSAHAATCPNEALREAQGATALPDCMALEMVSPPQKFAQTAFRPSFSASGSRLLYTAQAALVGTPGFQLFDGDRYVASRSAQGWQTAPTSPPAEEEIVFGGRYAGGPSAFTPDLSHWVQIGATFSQAIVGVFRLYEGGLGGPFAPFSPLFVPTDDSGTQEIQFSVPQIAVNGASADLSSAAIQGITPRISYLPGDPRTNAESEPGGDRNSYLVFREDGEPALELLARDKDGAVWGGRCGAHLGGPFGTTFSAGTFIQGAISPDGSRLYFSTRPAQPWDPEEAEGPQCDTDNPLRVMVRTASEAGPEIEPLLPGGQSEWEEAGDDLFEGASEDGAKVYFSTPRSLAASDTDPSAEECSSNLSSSKGCDLYLYDFEKPGPERLTHVSAGEGPASADALSPITAISKNGRRAYYVAHGVLTTAPNSEGATAQASKPNLYAFEAESGETSFIGTLAEADQGEMWGARGSFFGTAYAADEALAFASKAPLTADDEDGTRRDVFRWKASTDTLERISRATEGGSDNGPFDVIVNPSFPLPETNFGEQSRWVSEDGQAIAFATNEALIPSDEDGELNPYVWSSGQLGAVQAKANPKFGPAISPDGTQIAFSTKAVLVPEDGDTAEDVYVARRNGGLSFAIESTECDPGVEGSCRGGVTRSTAPAAPPSGTFSGPGNVKEPTTCRKSQVKRRGRCVKKPRKAKRRAGRRQGGGRR